MLFFGRKRSPREKHGRSTHQTGTGFEDHEGFFSGTLSERELCTQTSKGPRVYEDIREIIGLR